MRLFANVPLDAEVSAGVLGADLKMELRANVDAGSWQHRAIRSSQRWRVATKSR